MQRLATTTSCIHAIRRPAGIRMLSTSTAYDVCLATSTALEPTTSSWAIAEHVQSALEMVQTTTGLPWWATIACSAISVRAALFPLVLYQIKAQKRFAVSLPEMNSVMSEYRRANIFIPKRDRFRQLEAMLLLRKGVKLVWKKNQVHPMKCIASPIVQIPVFVSFAYSVREMIRNGTAIGLESGGFAWFVDLTIPDASYVLPILAASSTYMNFEISLKSKVGFIDWARKKLQYLPILSFPFIIQLPQGVFIYWLTSSSFTMIQTIALQNQTIRQRLGLIPSGGGQKIPSPSRKLIRQY